MSHFENLERRLPDLKKYKILDVGCGRGNIFFDFIKHGCNIIGVDRSALHLQILKDRANGIPVEVYNSPAETLPFPDKIFDFIHCNEVIEHTDDPEKVLKECNRVLKDRGKMYITFYNRWSIFDSHYNVWLINWLPRKLAYRIIEIFKLNNPNHKEENLGRWRLDRLHYYTYGQAVDLMKKYNFQVQCSQALKNPILFKFAKFFISSFHFYADKK